MYIGLVRSTPR